jgi:hypothetical protein
MKVVRLMGSKLTALAVRVTCLGDLKQATPRLTGNSRAPGWSVSTLEVVFGCFLLVLEVPVHLISDEKDSP